MTAVNAMLALDYDPSNVLLDEVNIDNIREYSTAAAAAVMKSIRKTPLLL